MQQGPFWKANCSSVTQETTRVLWDRKVQHHVQNSPQIVPFLSQLNQILPSLFLLSSWTVSFVYVCVAFNMILLARFLSLPVPNSMEQNYI